jgi:hypothetical protein
MALVRDLAAIERRTAGSDAERRAARLLAQRLRQQGRDARVESFWVRPSWAIVHALVCAAGVAGSVVAVAHPVTGAAVIGAAIILFAGDVSGRLPLLRRLTRERATQTVIAPAPKPGGPEEAPGRRARRRRTEPAALAAQPPGSAAGGPAAPGAAAPGAPPAAPRRAKAARRALAEAQAAAQTRPPAPQPPAAAGRAPRVTLLLTASVDAPRVGAGQRGGLAALQVRVRRTLGGMFAGPTGWATIALIVLLIVGAARIAGAEGPGPGVLALLPTVVLILLFGHFLDTALQEPGPGASSDASAAAAVLAAAEQLDADPPRDLEVEVVLAGAGDALAAGMRREVRKRRRDGLRPEQVAVIHVHACGSGTPVWWVREGLVVAKGYHPRLRALAAEVAEGRPELRAAAHETRGTSGARAARALRWPAIAVGAVDDRGVAAHAGTAGDTAAAVDGAAIDATVAFTVALIRRLDSDLRSAS